VHALQDQHFDLTRYDDGARTSDAYLARRAVTEGDATFAETRFQFEEQTGGAGIDRIDYADYFASWSAWSERYLDDSGYPLIFRAYTSFVYPYGLFFSAANLFGVSPLVRRPPPPPHQWSRQDALFTDRTPATTAEILGQADPVVAVGMDAIPAALAADLERIDTDTLGTWYTYLLFRPVASGLLLAGAWDGDRVLFARHTATGAVGVLWASAWDNESAAMAAEAALHALHDRAGEPLVIERRGVRVVLARNFPRRTRAPARRRRVRRIRGAPAGEPPEPTAAPHPQLGARAGSPADLARRIASEDQAVTAARIHVCTDLLRARSCHSAIPELALRR